jgi:hypothetical protein
LFILDKAEKGCCLERRHTLAKFVEFVALVLGRQWPRSNSVSSGCPETPMTVAEKCGAAAVPEHPFSTDYFLSSASSSADLLFALRRLETSRVVRHLILGSGGH